MKKKRKTIYAKDVIQRGNMMDFIQDRLGKLGCTGLKIGSTHIKFDPDKVVKKKDATK